MAVFPGCQINSAHILDFVLGILAHLVEYPHDDQLDREEHSHCVQIVDGLCGSGIAGLDQHESTVDDHVEDSDQHRRIFGCLAEHEHAQDGADDRQGDKLGHRVQECRDAVCVHDKGSDADGDDTCDGAVVFGNADTLLIRGSLAEFSGAEDVQGEHGGSGVQYRVKGGQDRTEQNGCEEAHDRLGDNCGDQSGISKVDRGVACALDGLLNGRKVICDDSGNDQVQRACAFEETAEDSTLLAFFQALGCKRSLNEGLVAAPPVNVVEQHAGEDQRPGQIGLSGVPVAPCVHLGGICFDHVFPAIDDTASASLFRKDRQGDERNQDAGDQKSDAVDCIRDGNRFQAAEDRVAAAYNADDYAETCHSREFAAADHSGDIKDPFEDNRAGIQDDGEVEDRIHDNDDGGENKLG